MRSAEWMTGWVSVHAKCFLNIDLELDGVLLFLEVCVAWRGHRSRDRPNNAGAQLGSFPVRHYVCVAWDSISCQNLTKWHATWKAIPCLLRSCMRETLEMSPKILMRSAVQRSTSILTDDTRLFHALLLLVSFPRTFPRGGDHDGL